LRSPSHCVEIHILDFVKPLYLEFQLLLKKKVSSNIMFLVNVKYMHFHTCYNRHSLDVGISFPHQIRAVFEVYSVFQVFLSRFSFKAFFPGFVSRFSFHVFFPGFFPFQVFFLGFLSRFFFQVSFPSFLSHVFFPGFLSIFGFFLPRETEKKGNKT